MTKKALLGFILLPALACVSASSVGATPVPAEWMAHNMIVELNQLPKGYTCDELWYKFRDVLFAIGARPRKILTYRCADQNANSERSPRVELTFELPQLLHGADVRWADVRTSKKAVVLSRGRPSSLDASDCELVRRMVQELIDPLGMKVVTADLACHARGPWFKIEIEANIAAAPAQQRSRPG